MNINELIGCAVSGDTRAVSELYDRYKNQIYYLCCLLVDGNEDVAAGMLQSAFMHVFGKLNLLKNPETFEAWSYTIAAKRCRSFYAGSGKTIDFSETAEQLPEGAEDENSFPYNNINTSRSDLVGDANACKAIESAVQDLPAAERFCILMFFFCRLTVDQIARTLQTDSVYVRRCIISGAALTANRIKNVENEIPSLSKYRGAAELGAILRTCADQISVPDRVSETIIATGMSLITTSNASPERNQDYTYNDGHAAAGENKTRKAGSIAVIVALIIILCGVVVAAVKIIPSMIKGGEEESGTSGETDHITDKITDTENSSDTLNSENTDNVQTEPVTEPETDPQETSQQVVPSTSEADFTVSEDANGYLTITGYKGSNADVVIPSSIGGKTVRYIGDSAFSGNTSLKSVIIPEGITYIGTYAFKDCTSLENISVPNSVKSVGRTILGNTKWLSEQSNTFVIIGDGVLIKINSKDSNISVPDGVKYISNVFYYIGTVESITLPSSVWGLGEFSFAVCIKLQSVTVPASVTSISENAFYECSALKSIITPDGSKMSQWCNSNGLGSIVVNG